MAQVVGHTVGVATPVRQARAASRAEASEGRRVPLVVGVYALVAILSLLFLSQTSYLSGEGYEVGALESARDHWKLRNDQIGLQISEAHSLQTVERDARRLGMAPPERVIYLQAPAAPTPAVEQARTSPQGTTRADEPAARQRAQ